MELLEGGLESQASVQERGMGQPAPGLQDSHLEGFESAGVLIRPLVIPCWDVTLRTVPCPKTL